MALRSAIPIHTARMRVLARIGITAMRIVFVLPLALGYLFSGSDAFARHLALRYLRTRRAAWLALAAVTLTVWVPIAVMGVMQGWLEVWQRQIRAAESDFTVSAPLHVYGLPEGYREQALQAVPGVQAVAPFISTEAVLALHGRNPRSDDERYDSRANVFAKCEGLIWQRDEALKRMAPDKLHATPTLDLSLPPIPPDQRGTAFLTPRWRSWLALRSLALADTLTGSPMPPQPSPRPGLIVGRELMYTNHGLHGPMGPGSIIQVNLPDAAGGRVGQFIAEVSDTIGTGVYEIDRYTVFAPLPQCQRLTKMDGTHPASQGVREITGYHVAKQSDADMLTVGRALDAAAPGTRVRHWTDIRGHLLRNVRQNRNVLGFVMICVQLICIFIIYALFSTLVAEKRHDIGVLIGLGARRRSVVAAFLFAALAICLIGGAAGWVLGWGTLAVLNPVSEALGVPLFPQEFMYTPEAPTSFNPLIPLTYVTIITVVGLVAAFAPAWRAGGIDPIATIRENG